MSNVPVASDPEVSFRPEFFDDCYESELANFWFRCRNRLIIWALNRYFTDARSFLEVGCGTGFVLSGIKEACPKLELAGSELFAEGLTFAKKRLPDVKLLELDARKLPFSEAYDVVGAFDVLEHIEEDQTVLHELWRACKQGIVLTVPQHKFLWSAVDEYACHKRRYSAAELQRKVEEAGFSVVRMTSFVSVLLPLMMLSRSKKRTLDQIGDPKAELQIPKTLDRMLEIALDFERWFIRYGINLPAGGSLLLIAIKNKK